MNHTFGGRHGHAYLCCLLFTLLLAPLGCKHRKVPSRQTEEEAGRLASTIHMGDARMGAQLLNGFYGVENNAWRWTAQQFTVALRPPFGAAQKGANLVVKLTVPPVVIEKQGKVTLSASVAGTPLEPEPYAKAGDYTYKREIPAALLAGDSARVEFRLDKAIPPSAADQRELGIIVLSAGLEPK
jgi:hypothetical protein